MTEEIIRVRVCLSCSHHVISVGENHLFCEMCSDEMVLHKYAKIGGEEK